GIGQDPEPQTMQALPDQPDHDQVMRDDRHSRDYRAESVAPCTHWTFPSPCRDRPRRPPSRSMPCRHSHKTAADVYHARMLNDMKVCDEPTFSIAKPSPASAAKA